MRIEKWVALCLVYVVCLLYGASAGLADAVPGDVIDKSNWEKAQGLVPEKVLDWLKRGDFPMKVVELNFDPKDQFPPVVKTSMEANKGKYDVDEDGLIVELATGKAPDFIEGVPFPEVDPNDPKAGIKIIYNKQYLNYTFGHVMFSVSAVWVGPKTGFEREVVANFKQYVHEGAPAVREEPNPEKMVRMVMVEVLSPFDVKGTNQLNWRYRDKRQDSNFAYIPAIRRVRRTSPANRSDSFVGSDVCLDDSWGFDGKPNSMDWKVVGKQEALMPFLSPDPQPFVITEEGGWLTSPTAMQPQYGFEVDGWQGVPWADTNIVWAKREVYVVEVTPKDPYYNYGVHYLWLDVEVPFFMAWKVINDRAGKFWKTMTTNFGVYQGPEEHQRAPLTVSGTIIDERRNHATVTRGCTVKYPVILNQAYDIRDFSLAGFARFCK